jgi:hypothetical protein
VRTCDKWYSNALDSWALGHGERSHGRRPREELAFVKLLSAFLSRGSQG